MPTEKGGLKMLSPNKRWGSEQLPMQFMKERNMQTKSTKNNIRTRSDTVYRYYEDTDTLSIYFAKASSGVVRYCEEASDYILVSYDGDDKIVSVEICEASELLCCHLFDTSEIIDNKPPLSFYPICYEDCNELEVLLVDSTLPSITFKETEDENIKVGINDKEEIVKLLFRNASRRLAKTLPEEEREKLAEEAKLRSLEISEWVHLLDEGAYK